MNTVMRKILKYLIRKSIMVNKYSILDCKVTEEIDGALFQCHIEAPLCETNIHYGSSVFCQHPLRKKIAKHTEEQRQKIVVNIDEKDKSEQQTNKNPVMSSRESAVTAIDFLLSIEALHQLYINNTLTLEEFITQKAIFIDKLSNRLVSETPRTFLGIISPLIDQKILSINEVHKIKVILFDHAR